MRRFGVLLALVSLLVVAPTANASEGLSWQLTTTGSTATLRGLSAVDGPVEIYGDAWFTAAHSWGKFIAQETTFHKRAWFSNFEADQLVDFKQAKFDGVAKLAQSHFGGKVILRGSRFAQPIDLNHSSFRGGLDMSASTTKMADTNGMTIALEMKNELPEGWLIDRTDEGIGLVRT
ncbi:hypothetical protein ACFQ1S_35690 [Kibdelosporangium lantanae]|uniref:Uncharacterized protein n=1 Tax=Kibdelosporangium lantanae TaxID=1497396 RepID=A0ABW3MIJ0_9PSEU